MHTKQKLYILDTSNYLTIKITNNTSIQKNAVDTWKHFPIYSNRLRYDSYCEKFKRAEVLVANCIESRQLQNTITFLHPCEAIGCAVMTCQTASTSASTRSLGEKFLQFQSKETSNSFETKLEMLKADHVLYTEVSKVKRI